MYKLHSAVAPSYEVS